MVGEFGVAPTQSVYLVSHAIGWLIGVLPMKLRMLLKVEKVSCF